MLRPDLPPPTLRTRLKYRFIREAGDALGWATDEIRRVSAIGPSSRRAKKFGGLGFGSMICAPLDSLVNPGAIRIGDFTIVAPHCALSAGWEPDQADLAPDMITIGDRCLIGRGASVIAHRRITIGDDVWTGHNVHITDMNHGYELVDRPIGEQWMEESPVSIGTGAWLGHGTVVLPGSVVGAHTVVGANSVVSGTLPDYSVAVGAPARVVRRHIEGEGWVDLSDDGVSRAERPAPDTAHVSPGGA